MPNLRVVIFKPRWNIDKCSCPRNFENCPEYYIDSTLRQIKEVRQILQRSTSSGGANYRVGAMVFAVDGDVPIGAGDVKILEHVGVRIMMKKQADLKNKK